MNNIDLAQLKKQMPIQWRVQSYSKKDASASYIAYIDARDVMELLDEVCSPENWQSDYKQVKNNLYAGIGIKINNEWIWKWDCGTESQTEKEKGEASDSFKRAGVKWGIGRFLYNIPIQYVKQNCIKNQGLYPYPVDNNGQKIHDIDKHLNNKVFGKKQLPKQPKTEPVVSEQSKVVNISEQKKKLNPDKVVKKILEMRFVNIQEYTEQMQNLIETLKEFQVEKEAWFTDAWEKALSNVKRDEKVLSQQETDVLTEEALKAIGK